jgi:hypothetical protein
VEAVRKVDRKIEDHSGVYTIMDPRPPPAAPSSSDVSSDFEPDLEKIVKKEEKPVNFRIHSNEVIEIMESSEAEAPRPKEKPKKIKQEFPQSSTTTSAKGKKVSGMKPSTHDDSVTIAKDFRMGPSQPKKGAKPSVATEIFAGITENFDKRDISRQLHQQHMQRIDALQDEIRDLRAALQRANEETATARDRASRAEATLTVFRELQGIYAPFHGAPGPAQMRTPLVNRKMNPQPFPLTPILTPFPAPECEHASNSPETPSSWSPTIAPQSPRPRTLSPAHNAEAGPGPSTVKNQLAAQVTVKSPTTTFDDKKLQERE